MIRLLLQDRFNLADFLLDFAREFLVLAFGCQVGIVRELSSLLLRLALQFMELALGLILRARFHVSSPVFCYLLDGICRSRLPCQNNAIRHPIARRGSVVPPDRRPITPLMLMPISVWGYANHRLKR